ncbi:hypothetical protein EOD39_8049 [Acipenser ruthenus]|uniref:Uncharacterized protein n=1 Tax=Acipenser ruthenus TaxID=7906 RepID=A0A662YWW1_ACIRT|nr:hypothetical protein EOD39_8049 [Acipenser ruthenus]
MAQGTPAVTTQARTQGSPAATAHVTGQGTPDMQALGPPDGQARDAPEVQALDPPEVVQVAFAGVAAAEQDIPMGWAGIQFRSAMNSTDVPNSMEEDTWDLAEKRRDNLHRSSLGAVNDEYCSSQEL